MIFNPAKKKLMNNQNKVHPIINQKKGGAIISAFTNA
jgi:hypothetical protein